MTKGEYFTTEELEAIKAATLNIVANLNRRIPSTEPLTKSELARAKATVEAYENNDFEAYQKLTG